MSKVRNYVFTLNNPTIDDEFEAYNFAEESSVRYIVVGKEVGESGTPHLQGYIVFVNPRARPDFFGGRAHWEAAKGTPLEASEYCKKDGDFFESGDLPVSKKEAALVAVESRWAYAKAGEFEKLAPEHIKIYEYIHAKYRDQPKVLDGELHHEWWYGAPGTGKTRKVYEDYPHAFRKDPQERWWDGYAGQDVVVIDDFDKYQKSQGGDMKRWLDRYPFPAAVKGSYMEIRPRKIIITSNYHPDDIWDDEITRAAIARRVKIVRFGEAPVFPIFATSFKPFNKDI